MEKRSAAEAQLTVTSTIAQTVADHRQREGHLSTLPLSVIHLRYVTDAALTRRVPMAATLGSLLGLHLESIGDLVDAEQLLKQACCVAEQIGDIMGWAQALTALSSTQEGLGHDQDSFHSAQRAVALFKEADVIDTTGLTEALYYQGWAHYKLGQAEAALHVADEGRILSHPAHLRRAEARFLSLMGVVNYYMLGHYDIAQQQLEESLAVYRELGQRQGESAVINNIGRKCAPAG